VTKYLEALYDYQFSLINDPHAAEIDRVITQMYGYSLLNLTPDAMFAYGNLLFASNGQPVSIPGNLQYLYTAEQFQDGLWHRTGTDGSWIDTSIARLIGQSQGILHGYTQTNIGRVNTILYGDNGQPRPIGPTLDYLRSISTGMLPVKTADPATIARGATAFVQAPNGLGVVLGQRDLVTGQIKYSVGSSVVIQNTKINIAALPISNEQKQELWFGVYRMLFDNNFYWTDQFKQSGTNTFELYIPAEMPYLSEANWQRLVTDINRLYDEKGMRVELVLFGGQYDPATNNNRQAILDATKKAAQALAGCRGVVSVKLFNEPDRFLPGQQGAIDEPWAVINMTLQQLYDFAGQQAEILHAYCPDLIVLLGTSSNLTADMMYAMRVENVDKFFNGFGTNAYPGGVNGNIPADEIPRGYGNLVDFAAGIGLPIVFSEMGVTVTSTLDYQASFASLLLSGAQTFMYGGAASAGERIVPRVTWYQGPPQEWQGADATMAVFIRNPDDSFSKKPVWDSIATAYDHMNDLIAPLANGARLASARKPNEPAGQPAHPKHFKRKRAKRVPTVTAQTGGARLALDIGKVTELFRNEAVAPLAAALLEKAQIEALAGIK
ncbi:MAG: hypothetical protein WCG06_05875, partial [Candidatus Omnitrophota bacterium]